MPYEINVAIGATVSWSNDDSAAHTVTSGTVTAGITDVFDSSLFMAGDVLNLHLMKQELMIISVWFILG